MKSFMLFVTKSAMLLALVFLVGCAFGTRQVTLHYPPVADSKTATASLAAKTSKNVSIILKPFTDQRADQKVIGTVRNGFGMRTADVVPLNSVTEWVNSSLRTELESNGYTVLSDAPSDTLMSKTAVVSGEVLNVFCDMYMSYTGQVSIISRISRDGKELLNKHYQGEGTAGLAWAGTGESFGQSLALAMSVAAKQLISDLDKVFSNP